MMRRGPPARQNDPVNEPQIKDRWNAGVAALMRATIPPSSLSRWAWIADAVLALALAAGALDDALNRNGSSTESLTPPSQPSTPPGVPVAPTPPVGLIIHHYGAAHPWQLILAV